MMLQHVSEPFRPLASVEPDVDPALAGWVERLLTKDTGKRPGDANAAWDELEEIVIGTLGPRWRRDSRLVEETLEPEPKAPVPSAAPARRRRRWIAAFAAAAALLTGGVVAGLELAGGSGSPPDSLPPPAERASLAVSGPDVFLADPAGSVHRLGGASLREKASGPEHPAAIVASGGAAFAAEGGSLAVLRNGSATIKDIRDEVVALAGGEDSSLVVATTRRICLIGPGWVAGSLRRHRLPRGRPRLLADRPRVRRRPRRDDRRL